MPVAEQIAILLAASGGHLNDLPADQLLAVESRLCQAIGDQIPDVVRRIDAGEKFSDADRQRLAAEYKWTIENRLLPSYRRLRGFIATRYLPATRASAVVITAVEASGAVPPGT